MDIFMEIYAVNILHLDTVNLTIVCVNEMSKAVQGHREYLMFTCDNAALNKVKLRIFET